MQILLTNDDGYFAKGINFLREALISRGHRVLVVAPDRERSAVSKALTLHRPLRLRKIGEDFYISDGTPNDCIYLALGVVLSSPPDFVLSGMNMGPNLGDDVIYSGTVGAAILGTHFRIPSVAFSFASEENHGDEPLKKAAEKAAELLDLLARRPLRDVTLNVNIPAPPWKGVKITKLGMRKYTPEIIERTDPRGYKYYWIGIGSPKSLGDENSDIFAVSNGYISITPIHADMTAYSQIPVLEKLLDEVVEKAI